MLNISELTMCENIYAKYGTIPVDCAILFSDDLGNIQERYNIYRELYDKYMKKNEHFYIYNNVFENLGGDLECTNFQNIDEYLSTIDYTAKETYLNECLNNLSQFDNVLNF